jgi:hypothetical protein
LIDGIQTADNIARGSLSDVIASTKRTRTNIEQESGGKEVSGNVRQRNGIAICGGKQAGHD